MKYNKWLSCTFASLWICLSSLAQPAISSNVFKVPVTGPTGPLWLRLQQQTTTYSNAPVETDPHWLAKQAGFYRIGMNGRHIFNQFETGEYWQEINGFWIRNPNLYDVYLDVETNTTPINSKAHDINLKVYCQIHTTNVTAGHFLTPNGKFALFKLLDPRGDVVHPKKNAGKNIANSDFFYRSNVPAWAAPIPDTLEADFPLLATNARVLYPKRMRLESGRIIVDQVIPQTVKGPEDMVDAYESFVRSFNIENPICISELNLPDLFQIKKEGKYTLILQPVLYIGNHTDEKNEGILDRIDLPIVTTNFYFVP